MFVPLFLSAFVGPFLVCGFPMNPAIDLGCLDVSCISVSDKQSHDPVLDERGGSPVPSPSAAMTISAASKIRKVNRSRLPSSEIRVG